jgi:Family of unknown function (DUF5681)
VSEEQEPQPLTGKAKRLANLKPFVKGKSGNPSGRPKDLARFGDLLVKEFFKTVTASMNGKTINKMQGEIIAMQMVKNAINKGPVAQALILKVIEAHEAREAKREELLLKRQLEGTSETNWDDAKEALYQRFVKATAHVQVSAQTED